ncbi:hypothetical protein BDZ89DRAFT_730362 [Hymenopellis radicata]|nr:hypothetical protein BDZ89DRAFT_730362 [Hymenopellis radicata]
MTDASNLAVVVIQSVNVIVADIVLVWRCWSLYERTWKITAPLTAGFLAEIVSSSAIIALISKRNADYSEQTKWTFVYCLTTVLINGLCTLLIVLRLLRSNRTYRKIIEILVESALAYTIAYIALLVVYGYEFYTVRGLMFLCRFRYPWAISNSITGIAPTLIIGRVMARSDGSSRSRLATRILRSAHPLVEPSLFIGASQQGLTITDIALQDINGPGGSEDGTDGDQDGHDVSASGEKRA